MLYVRTLKKWHLNTNRKVIKRHADTGKRAFWGARIVCAKALRQEFYWRVLAKVVRSVPLGENVLRWRMVTWR